MQIRGPALRLIRGAVAPDHDLACFRAPQAIDRVQGDAVRGPDLAMEAASLVPLIWPGRFVKEQRLGG